jgi:hypothetical protein
VKVIIDAEVGSIATKAKEIKATWVILDRYYYTLSNYSILSNNLNNNVTTLNILNFSKKQIPKEGSWSMHKTTEQQCCTHRS